MQTEALAEGSRVTALQLHGTAEGQRSACTRLPSAKRFQSAATVTVPCPQLALGPLHDAEEAITPRFADGVSAA